MKYIFKLTKNILGILTHRKRILIVWYYKKKYPYNDEVVRNLKEKLECTA